MPKFYEVFTNYALYLHEGWNGIPSGLAPAAFYERAFQVSLHPDFLATLGPATFYETRMAMQAEARWYAVGCPTYKIYPSVTEALASTSIDIDCDMFEMPFPTIALRFSIDGWRERDGSPYVRTIMVHDEMHMAAPSDRRHKIAMQSMWTGGGSSVADILGNGVVSRFSLVSGQSINECLSLAPFDVPHTDGKYWPAVPAIRAMTAMVISTCFIAIGADRTLIRPEPVSVTDRLKRERAIRKAGPSADEFKRGWAVGADIKLPKHYDDAPHAKTPQEGERRELHFGHIRSGHCRWQPHKDESGERRYRLTFIKPTIVRADLPLKPKLTERALCGDVANPGTKDA